MECICGSGLEQHRNYDARGIYLCATCDVCHDKKMAGYRPDVLSDPNYWSDEPIEPEDY